MVTRTAGHWDNWKAEMMVAQKDSAMADNWDDSMVDSKAASKVA